MFDPKVVDAIIIRSPSDVRAAAEALQKAVTALADVRPAICHNIASKQPMVDADGHVLACDVFGWDAPEDRWWQNTRMALDAPIPAACRYESEPFWCNELGFYTRQQNRHLEAIDLGNMRERHKTASAIVVPVHLPFGQIAAASFCPHDAEVTDLSDIYQQHADTFAVYVRTFISGYVKVMCAAHWLPPGARLSKREVECLRWAAVGKTDHEISLIMARSRATVRFHIHNASVKLNAVNRSQTVFKATQLGFLGMVA